MTIFILIIGAILPVSIGWMTLLHLEGKEPLLGKTERWFWALILGPTEFCLIVFIAHVAGLTALNLLGFLIPSVIVLAMLIALGAWRRLFARRIDVGGATQRQPLPRCLRIGILLFAAWTAIKIFAGAYDLLSVPTYWDDSFNNWNMRGKIYHQTERLALEIPNGNGVVQSAQGVGSYPPTVPMMKAWLSILRGAWEESVVNGLHLVWFIGILGAFFFALRRRLSPELSLAGTCLLVSLPLFLIQGTNPYADVAVAGHVFLSVVCLAEAAASDDRRRLAAWLLLCGFCLGLLMFTKNEGTLLYAPVATLLFLRILIAKQTSGIIDRTHALRTVGVFLMSLLILAGPWLLFKWSHGLTFGNAKAVSDLSLSLNTKVIQSIWFQLSHEPNWLLLPVVLPFLWLATRKTSMQFSERILGMFVFITIMLQFLIFTFVRSLATEAIMQTGLNRGLVHIAPTAMLLTILLAVNLLNDEEALDGSI